MNLPSRSYEILSHIWSQPVWCGARLNPREARSLWTSGERCVAPPTPMTKHDLKLSSRCRVTAHDMINRERLISHIPIQDWATQEGTHQDETRHRQGFIRSGEDTLVEAILVAVMPRHSPER